MISPWEMINDCDMEINKKKILRITQYVIIGGFALLLLTVCTVLMGKGIQTITRSKSHALCVYEDMNRLKYENIKYELVTSIDDYIQTVAPHSSLNGLAIVDNCLKYNMDVCFVLAQGQNESQFGTTGLARKTNSVFNVLAFDGHKFEDIHERGKYKYPDESIEPYMELLQKDYLVNGKTEFDLMHKYVNKQGKRYASSETYESALKNTYLKIKNTTKIDSLSQELQKYKLILGIE